MLTDRDLKVIDFLEECKVARTSTIQELFYPSKLVTQIRLKKIIDMGELKRARDNVSTEYIYYLKKPKQLQHSLIVTDFYRELHKYVTIIRFKPEFSIGNLRADALVGYQKNGINYLAFLEVQLSNTPVDVNKYEKLYHSGEYRKYFNSFPIIFVVTNKNIPTSDLSIKKIDLKMERLSELL